MVGPPAGDVEVVAALRAGNEAAFVVALILAYHSLLHRTAMTYVSSRPRPRRWCRRRGSAC